MKVLFEVEIPFGVFVGDEGLPFASGKYCMRQTNGMIDFETIENGKLGLAAKDFMAVHKISPMIIEEMVITALRGVYHVESDELIALKISQEDLAKIMDPSFDKDFNIIADMMSLADDRCDFEETINVEKTFLADMVENFGKTNDEALAMWNRQKKYILDKMWYAYNKSVKGLNITDNRDLFTAAAPEERSSILIKQ